MNWHINFYFTTFILTFNYIVCSDVRYAEQDLDKSNPKYIEIVPRFTKQAKIEREYRPKKNFTKKEQLYEITKNKQQDELNFMDNLDKYEYKRNYVKIPKISQDSVIPNLTEISTPVETTLEKYKSFPPNTEFVTSRNFNQKPSIIIENSKSMKENEDGFFTKINTVLRNQFTKIFNPYREESNNETTRKIGTKSFDKYFMRYGTVERVQDKPKNKRFLNIFTILQFENSRCQAQGSFLSYEGTCYHRSECTALGGYSMGACAKGFGVCCICKYILLCPTFFNTFL